MLKTITQTKVCRKCKVEQDFSCFSRDKSTKDGLKYECKGCKKLYYQNNKNIILFKRALYHRDNIVDANSKSRKYYKENKDKLLAQKKIYRKSKSGIASRKNTNHRRRTKEKQGDVTKNELLELEQTAKACYWCGKSLKKEKVHIDHYIPLSKGGEHTLSNLVVTCPKCNLTKNAKDPIVFANSVGRLL
ncbi:MAG: HNH endonuclease [Sulfurimonas denitrificans]|nr:HNH endonuclease [Sulfurimonas denitrificans]